jgi:2'-5' RNA ligase
MSLLRAFIAIEIPSEIQAAIARHTAPLQAALDDSMVRWVPTHNLHLTLKFLGDVSPANLELLTQMLTVEASQQGAFEMGFSGIGAFPDARRPRVLWIGIQAPAELEALSHGIEAACARLGYPGEKRPFSPHLTIGRVKQNIQGARLQSIRAALESTRIDHLGTAHITDVRLFKSELKPTGAVYTQLFSAPLST